MSDIQEMFEMAVNDKLEEMVKEKSLKKDISGMCGEISEIHDQLLQMRADFEKESKKNHIHFLIATFFAAVAAIASVLAALHPLIS